MKRFLSRYIPGSFKGILLGVVVLLTLVATGSAQELTLYTMCPPRSLDWSSPRSLAFGAIGNQFTFIHRDHKHAIGHVFVELKNGEARDLTGSVPAGDSSGNKAMIFKDGYCMGILFAPIKGRLETAADLDPQLVDRYKTGRVAFITFKLSPSTYERLATYLKEYRERGYDQIYNGLNLPREGKGAGCSGFGVSLLEVAGLLHPVWKQYWAVHVRVQDSLIGGPMTGKNVSIAKVLLKGSWAKEGEAFHQLDMYDPDLIYKWITSTHKRETANPTGKVSLTKRGKALGLIYDCTHLPTPTDPIFLNE